MEWWEWILLVFVVLYGIGWGLHFSGALDEIAKAEKGKKLKTKHKYKVGDRVRIVDKWGLGCGINLDGEMDHWLGEVMTIRAIENGSYRMKEDQNEQRGLGWWWSDDMIAGLAGHEEKLTPLKIVVTTDGKTTLARYYEGKKVVHTAEATCSPDDTFDFGTGAKLATERLLEKMKPKFKVGDVVKIVGNTYLEGHARTIYHHLAQGTYAIVLRTCGDALVCAGINTTDCDSSQIVYTSDVERVEIK